MIYLEAEKCKLRGKRGLTFNTVWGGEEGEGEWRLLFGTGKH